MHEAVWRWKYVKKRSVGVQCQLDSSINAGSTTPTSEDQVRTSETNPTTPDMEPQTNNFSSPTNTVWSGMNYMPDQFSPHQLSEIDQLKKTIALEKTGRQAAEIALQTQNKRFECLAVWALQELQINNREILGLKSELRKLSQLKLTSDARPPGNDSDTTMQPLLDSPILGREPLMAMETHGNGRQATSESSPIIGLGISN